MLLGDFILLVGILIWLAISVGPWWVAPILFVVAMIVNDMMNRALKRYFSEKKQETLTQLQSMIQNYYKSLDQQKKNPEE